MKNISRLILLLSIVEMLTSCATKTVTPLQYLSHKLENSESPKRRANWEIPKEDLLDQLPCYREVDRISLGQMLVSHKEFRIGKNLGKNPYMKGHTVRNNTEWEHKIEEKFILITYTCKSSDNLGNVTERIVEIEIDKHDVKNRKFKIIKSH